MPHRSVYAVQVFERRDGELMAGDREVTTRESVVRRAAALADTAAGAVAMSLSTDSRGARAATFLAAFGEVPREYAESVVGDWSISRRYD